MHRLAVADVVDLGELNMLPRARKPRSATRGYSCAILDPRSSNPDLFRHSFVIHFASRASPRRPFDLFSRAALSECDASSHRFQSAQHFQKATPGRARIPKASRNRLIVIRHFSFVCRAVAWCEGGWFESSVKKLLGKMS